MKIYRIVSGTRVYKIVKENNFLKLIIATILLLGVGFWIYAGILSIPIINSKENLDFDGDGIPNYRDEFPDTPPKAVVDSKGKFLGVNLEINFDTDSDIVSSSYADKLKDFANYLKKHPDQIIEIQGHTDDQMSTLNNNLDLSYRRAYSVAKILIVNYGVPTNQLIVKGYGALKPMAKNNSETQRSMNRRIEAVLVK